MAPLTSPMRPLGSFSHYPRFTDETRTQKENGMPIAYTSQPGIPILSLLPPPHNSPHPETQDTSLGHSTQKTTACPHQALAKCLSVSLLTLARLITLDSRGRRIHCSER